jgi:hypothetical protein
MKPPTPPTGLQAMISNKMFGKKKPTKGKKPMPKVAPKVPVTSSVVPPKGIAVGNPALLAK